MASVAELAWSAGIIDGEGCIHISRGLWKSQLADGVKTIRHTLYVKVTMGHRPTLERLLEIFGVGSICDAPQKKTVNPAFTWLCTTKKAKVVLEAVRPYLVTKASEADVALAFLLIPKQYRGGKETPLSVIRERDRLCLELRALKPTSRLKPPPPTFEQILGRNSYV